MLDEHTDACTCPACTEKTITDRNYAVTANHELLKEHLEIMACANRYLHIANTLTRQATQK